MLIVAGQFGRTLMIALGICSLFLTFKVQLVFLIVLYQLFAVGMPAINIQMACKGHLCQ